MKKIILILLFGTSITAQENKAFVFSCYGYEFNNTKRISSAPYISGDSFRAIADFVIDELQIPFDPSRVKKGDIIFVNGDIINEFLEQCHELIAAPYILLTHNSDKPISDKYNKYLEDNKLLKWFAQNATYEHKKLIPIPIGLANGYWPHGKIEHFNKYHDKIYEKKYLVYANFLIDTYPLERQRVYDLFVNKQFCYVTTMKKIDSYLEEMAQAQFVLSPRGNGLDCHRTWEALLVGAIPILKKTELHNNLFQDLPVLLVSDWSEITEAFLHEQYNIMRQKKYDRKKLFIQYWIDTIKTVQIQERCKTITFEESMSTSYCFDSELNKQWHIFKNLYEEIMQNKYSMQPTIPKKIHWIWLGSPLPEKYKKIHATWRQKHPGWEFKLWTDNDIAGLNLKNKEQFDKAINWGEKSDILRYEILERFGGLYIDVDFECLQSFDWLHTICDFYAGIAYDKRPLLYNGLIGATPNHPIINACVNQVRASGTQSSELIMQYSGPYFFSRIFFDTIANCAHLRNLPLPVTYVYPCPNNINLSKHIFDHTQIEKYIKPESLAVHYWGTSWVND
jgi:inositol phosphorylceramide mannosyltransferase catalytic subunit